MSKWLSLLSPMVLGVSFVALSVTSTDKVSAALWGMSALFGGCCFGMELTDKTRRQGRWEEVVRETP